MKKYSILVFLLITYFSSCNKIDELTQFEVDYNTNFKIPSTVGINLPFNIPTPDITTNISEKLENEQTNKELIEQLYLKKLKLKITSPSSKTFKFLKNIDLYLKTDNLPKIKVAYKYNISNNVGSEIELDIVKNLDLQEYVKEDNFILDTKFTIDEIILEEIKVDADLKFWVDAEILGI